MPNIAKMCIATMRMDHVMNEQRIKELLKFTKKYINPDVDVDKAFEQMKKSTEYGLDIEKEFEAVIQAELEYNNREYMKKHYGYEQPE